MIEIPFWQSAAAGAVLAALITALSSWFQRRRDDRIESRRTRREAGADAIRTAFRLKAATVEVVSRSAREHDARAEGDDGAIRHLAESTTGLWRQWIDTWNEAGQHSMTARALAAPHVGELLYDATVISADWIQELTEEGGWDEPRSQAYRKLYDSCVSEIVNIVRADAKIDGGVAHLRGLALRRWFRIRKRS